MYIFLIITLRTFLISVSALLLENCLKYFDDVTCWLSGERSMPFGLLVILVVQILNGPQIIFCYFFRMLNLVIFQDRLLSKCIDSWYLVCATPPTLLCQCFWNFTGVVVMVWRCASGFDIIFGLFFVTFSACWTQSFSLNWYLI